MSYHSRLALEEKVIAQRLNDGDVYFTMKCLKLMVEKGKTNAAHRPYLLNMYNQYLKARKLHRNIKWFIPDFHLGKLSNFLKSYRSQLAEMMVKGQPQVTQEQTKMDFSMLEA